MVLGPLLAVLKIRRNDVGQHCRHCFACNSLTPVWRQTITLTSAGLLLTDTS